MHPTVFIKDESSNMIKTILIDSNDEDPFFDDTFANLMQRLRQDVLLVAANSEAADSALKSCDRVTHASLSSNRFKLSIDVVNLSNQVFLLCINTFKIFSSCRRVVCLCDVDLKYIFNDSHASHQRHELRVFCHRRESVKKHIGCRGHFRSEHLVVEYIKVMLIIF